VSGDVNHLRLEAQDLVAAYQLHHRVKLRSWRTAVGGGLALLALAGLLIALGEGWPAVAAGLVGGVVGGFAVPVMMLRWRVPAVARRIFQQQKQLNEETNLAWNADGLRVRTPNLDGRTPWAHFRRWREDGRVVLLYHSDALFQFIPKGVLSPEQLADLRACAAAGDVPGA